MLTELSKRKVPSVVTGYAVACFVILQIADVTFEALGFTAGHVRLVLIGMIAGLPIVAYLAWKFDLKGGSVETEKSSRPILELGSTVFLSIGLFVGALYYWPPQLDSDDSATPPVKNSEVRLRIAVEQFTYPSGNEQLKDYASLLRNQVSHHLGQLAQPTMDLVESVDDAHFVATGSMNNLADGVRFFVQVINTESGIVHWSKGLELPPQPTEEFIATRPEHIATLVFQVALLSNMASSMTESTEATLELVAGAVETSELWQGLGGDWNAGLAHFNRAHELDPQWVLPPFNLANLYVNRLGGQLRYENAIGPIYEHTRKALKINENWTWLAGWVNLHDFHFDAASANLEHARDIGWPAAGVEFSLGLMASAQGHLDKAIARFNTTLALGAGDNQAMAYTFIAGSYLASGRFTAAANAAEKAVIETAGTGAYAHLHALKIKIYAQYFNDDQTSARETLNLAWNIFGQDSPEHFAGALALLGDTQRAREALSSGEARWAQGEGLFPSAFFWGHFHLGDLDSAFIWLNRAIEDREIGFLPELRRSPLLDPIRNDVRFVAAMARLAEIEAEIPPITTVAYPKIAN